MRAARVDTETVTRREGLSWVYGSAGVLTAPPVCKNPPGVAASEGSSAAILEWNGAFKIEAE